MFGSLATLFYIRLNGGSREKHRHRFFGIKADIVTLVINSVAYLDTKSIYIAFHYLKMKMRPTQILPIVSAGRFLENGSCPKWEPITIG